MSAETAAQFIVFDLLIDDKLEALIEPGAHGSGAGAAGPRMKNDKKPLQCTLDQAGPKKKSPLGLSRRKGEKGK